MLSIILAATLAAQPLEVRPASGPITIDAKLDEAAWSQATPIPVAFEWYPSDNIAAPVATEAFVTYDERKLYVAFRAHDPKPALIRARYHERDGGGDDDVVGFYIDPFNDDRRAYQFRVNPLGVQIDAINSDVEETEDFSWDGIWDSAGRITEDGYVVEIAVPLQQLRIPSSQGAQTWGFLAVREWPRDVNHRLRSIRTDQNRDCIVCQFQDLHGFALTATGRQIEITPTLTGRAVQERGDDGGFTTTDDGLDAGASARWAITPGTSLQATLNPDFSQVEADAAQLDVNTRFALSFPEKRPFFFEGADFFETRIPIVFTRTIADPAAGLKLTGKSGPNMYGLLFTRDEVTNLLIPGDQSSRLTSIAGASTSTFARYRRELGASVTVGGLVTSRSGEDYDNQVLSADSYFRLTPRDSLRFQVAGTRTQYPDDLATRLGQPQGSFSGHGLQASYNHTDRNWSWYAHYIERSPEFRADSGFVNQVGVRAGQAGFSRRVRGGPERWFRNLYLDVGVDSTKHWEGEWNEWGADLSATYQGPRQTEISVNLAPNQEHFLGRTYHNLRYSIFGETQVTRDVQASLELRGGENIDFTNAQEAEFVTIAPALQLNLGTRFRGEISYIRQWFDRKDGAPIFDVSLPQARLLWHFSRRSFVRAIVQYESLERFQPAAGKSKDLLTQLLFSYRLDAQTVFLAGYSDTYAGRFDLQQLGRTIFVKVSYAWLL